MTREVSAVSILLQDLEEQAASSDLIQVSQDNSQQVKLRSLIDGIVYPLRELEELATKYSSLSTAKKNNWDRLRFAARKISDIRTRLILHMSLMQNFIDGLANRRIISIERRSEDTNVALTRIERAISDILRDIKSGSRGSSASDEKWNIWTELERELRVEGFPVKVAELHKNEIKQFFYKLRCDSGLQDNIFVGDITPPTTHENKDEELAITVSNVHEFHAKALETTQTGSSSSNQGHWSSNMMNFLLEFNPAYWPIIADVLLIFLYIIFLLVSEIPGISIEAKQLIPSFSQVNATSMASSRQQIERGREELLNSDDHWMRIEINTGVLRNTAPVTFTCSDMLQAQEWIDQLSPLVEAGLVDSDVSAMRLIPFLPLSDNIVTNASSHTVVCPAQLMDDARPGDSMPL